MGKGTCHQAWQPAFNARNMVGMKWLLKAICDLHMNDTCLATHEHHDMYVPSHEHRGTCVPSHEHHGMHVPTHKHHSMCVPSHEHHGMCVPSRCYGFGSLRGKPHPLPAIPALPSWISLCLSSLGACLSPRFLPLSVSLLFFSSPSFPTLLLL